MKTKDKFSIKDNKGNDVKCYFCYFIGESIYCKYCIDNKLKPKPNKIFGKDLRV